jgi:endonuclease-3
LERLYPNPAVPLDYRNPFTLCIAVLLSAQTTDKAVNLASPALFKVADHPQAMFALGPEKIQKFIKTIGLSNTKSRNIWNLSRILIERYHGELPSTLAQLEELPGVGHKTASVVMSQAFGEATFPVDTHIHRLAERWGLSKGLNVEQTEKDLKKLYPSSSWPKLHLQFIYYGREFCPARGHDPIRCEVCEKFGKKSKLRSR